jgi:two-component system, chemotaxis family, chemotaxis protein CheY
MFAPSTRVLVVDDMMTMRKIVIKICKEIGFTDITEAADGNQAWEAISNANPPIGLVISDWNMPNCTGLELLKRLRTDHRYKKTPFILVTAEAEKSQIMDAAKAGVDQYVVKPFTKEDVIKKLEAVHKKYVG